jgi:hypothetical protein
MVGGQRSDGSGNGSGLIDDGRFFGRPEMGRLFDAPPGLLIGHEPS